MEAPEKLSVTVTTAMARMIREKVEDGSFHSALRARLSVPPSERSSARKNSMLSAWHQFERA
ncbi:hypothetical protein [Mesorhizobium sp. CA4]|uniref:hypothetical protein n=1 Tax=Mesorhizobium sp. CA4 TaxID=588499 RepID=UPI001CD0F93E|nr:hypothetical protein [Mesorhizobium sp. CA4]MBZ9817913.1 hypothetical protein [Mesorhizobium sp. CA4]